jgi:hypothetical protein
MRPSTITGAEAQIGQLAVSDIRSTQTPSMPAAFDTRAVVPSFGSSGMMTPANDPSPACLESGVPMAVRKICRDTVSKEKVSSCADS